MSETPIWGYALQGIDCDSNILLEEYFTQPFVFEPDDSSGAFSVVNGDAYCTVTNRFSYGNLDVSTVVINDNGGTATATDVSFEVFRADTTPQIAATSCTADGACYADILPVGDYVMGYVGPAGYTVDITINDPVPATTTTTTTPTTTTLAPTTTVFDSGGVTLPNTGTSSETSGWMATVALLFVASGGALLLARRRTN